MRLVRCGLVAGAIVLGFVGCSASVERTVPRFEAAELRVALRRLAPDDGRFDAVELRERLRAAVAVGVFPGCAVAVGTSEEPLFIEGFGALAPAAGPGVPGSVPIDAEAGADTLWDLASLTKIVSTTTLALRFLADGSLRLEAAVGEVLPEFLERATSEEDRVWRAAVTIEHLLTHSSGLPAWRPLYLEANSLDAILDGVLATPLEAAPGERAVYSDLGIILLGAILARVGGEPFDALERRLIFEPLGMEDTSRRVADEDLHRTAPTELDAMTGHLIHGIVHDENARAAGGLTAHAGLFSTAIDLAVFATAWLRAHRGFDSPLPSAIVREFTRRRELVPGSSRALGWDTPSGRSSSGSFFSGSSFGHTGFTGTSMWIDPERDLWVILLSNRVCPTRENSKIGTVRRDVADAAVRGLRQQTAASEVAPGRE